MMRYIIGIDLGTTNSCVAYIDTQEERLQIKSFKIPQVVGVGIVEELPTLPSFCYLTSPNEFPIGSFLLPWENKDSVRQDFFVGSFAKKQGGKVPTHVIQSAKSWLCHSAANRRDKILPLEASDEKTRISPVEATSRFLAHVKEAWNNRFAKEHEENSFDYQEIILTVPASFDEVARALTVEAAKKAGYIEMTLLEEPQAAFYSWVSENGSSWENILKKEDQILVCDVGGGTTDFSLIEVVETDAKLSFRRMAVGDHLLLGGDNMDVAICRFLEQTFTEKGQELSSTQRQQLLYEARQAKEILFTPNEKELYRILIYGEGSHLVKSMKTAYINKEEAQKLLLNGFFGIYPWNEALKLNKTSGFRSMGLPYENEPSIVKHLAHFLAESGKGNEAPIKPDFILFNGGAMKPLLFQEAIMQNLKNWFPEKKLSVLPSYHLDLAVSRGAAYFAKARRGLGVKIGGGLARSYYLALDKKNEIGTIEKKALTLMSRGSEEGTFFEPLTTFMLTPNTPCSFQLLTSHIRLNDIEGDLVPINLQEMHYLPSIQTVLRFGKKQGLDQDKIPVHLQVKFTPIGTLEIGLKSLKTDHHWILEFQLKTASGQDHQSNRGSEQNEGQQFDLEHLNRAKEVLKEAFETDRSKISFKVAIEKLEDLFELSKKDWSLNITRGLADVLLELAFCRKLSLEHFEKWWNLIGFFMRPGFGYPLDDYRIKEIWKLILNDYQGKQSDEANLQMWICYRRLAGGLGKGQQNQLASDLISSLLNKRTGKIEIEGRRHLYAYSEKIRALASMELIDNTTKVRIGEALIEKIQGGGGINADYWALGRIGARHLIYGSLVNVIAKDVCHRWIDHLLSLPLNEERNFVFLFEQLGRKTKYVEVNISFEYVEKILRKWEQSIHYPQIQKMLNCESSFTEKEHEHAFGETLPPGLILIEK